MESILSYQWILIIITGLVFIVLAPLAKHKDQFFNAISQKGKQATTLMLTSSLVISWIFAKSITNAANLGASFGLVGGLAYATYYLSFIVAGVIIYNMRVKGGFKSIHTFLQHKYGKAAVVLFSILIAFRLFNEVWSNTMVIGSYFGEAGSQPYYLSIIVFTVLTLVYTLKGGLSSSLLTDAIQMVLFGLLLFMLLIIILPNGEATTVDYITSGSWTFAGGLNLMLVAFIQIFSYPFHDSVMTDRGFISDPKTTRKSFMLAALIGFICLTAFSLIGVYAKFKGVEGQAAVEVSKLLGVTAMLSMNFIMITSAASTLDSAFSSFSKLSVTDLQLFKKVNITNGRISMVIICVLGTIPIFMGPEILSATTISGTMVLGLAPVFLFWNKKVHPLAFHLSVGSGILIGLVFAFGWYPASWHFTDGKYADLLSANLFGTVVSFSLFFLTNALLKFKTNENEEARP